MIATNTITDLERAKFLEKLDESDLIVSEWEANFLHSYKGTYRYWQFFTDGRRESTDKMRMKYGSEIGMPFPADNLPPAIGEKIPEGDANCCQFILLDIARRQHACNAPATKQRQNGFRYCDSHAEQVERDCKRRGKIIHLFPFNPK